MNVDRRIVAALATGFLLLQAPATGAFNIGGGGINAGGSVIAAPNLAGLPSGEGYRDLKVSGRVLARGEPVPANGRVVRLRIEHAIVPMVLDQGPADPEDLSLNRKDEYERDRYHSLLTKEVRVIASERDVATIEGQNDSPDRLRIEGSVRGVSSPILTVDSVRRAH